MTNRTTYTLFTKFDDPEIEQALDNGQNVIIYHSDQFLELTKREGYNTTIFQLREFPYKYTQGSVEPIVFSLGLINVDVPNLSSFLNKFLPTS